MGDARDFLACCLAEQGPHATKLDILHRDVSRQGLIQNKQFRIASMIAETQSAHMSWADVRRENLSPTRRMPEPDLTVHPAFKPFVVASEPASRQSWFTRLLGRGAGLAGTQTDQALPLCAAVEDCAAEITASLPADPELLLPKLDEAIDLLIDYARNSFGRETNDINNVYEVFTKHLKAEARREIYFAARRMAYQRREPNEAAKALLPTLARRGVVGIDIGKRRVERIRSYVESHIKRLNESASVNLKGGDPFDRGKLLRLPEEQGFVGELKDLMDETGIASAMKYYLGHEVGLNFAHLHISKPDDQWFRRIYEDLDLYPRTRDLHYDSPIGIMKCVLYLDDIDEGQGPFRYVPGSHRWETDLLPRLSAKANGYANDLSTPLEREVFAKLPSALRHYSHLGYNIVDEHPLSEQLLSLEEMQTSDRAGHLVMFDPFGLHRGGQCRTGDRTCIQLVFTPIAEIGKSIYPF